MSFRVVLAVPCVALLGVVAAFDAGRAQVAPLAGLTQGGTPELPRMTPWQAQGYDCANVSCKRLGSCEEACYKLKVCGQTRRDGDGDGIPCENLCSRRCP